MAKEVEAFDLSVSFGDVSVGDKTARLPVSVDRTCLKLSKADGALCDRRLSGSIEMRPSDEANDQGRLNGMEHIGKLTMPGIFDVKGFRVSKKKISFALTFAIASIDIGKLAQFAKRSGSLTVDSVEDIPEKESVQSEDEEDDK